MKIKIDYKILILMMIFFLSQNLWIYLILLAFCIVHELGHVLSGILLGRKIEKFELMAIGCRVKFFDEEEFNPIKDIIISASGPLINFILVIFFLVQPIHIKYVEFYIYGNLLLGVFNLLPIYPLDGGRIIKNILELIKNDISVEEITNNISNITLIILTMIASILVIYFKNIFIFITILYLWYILMKENKRYFFSKE